MNLSKIQEKEIFPGLKGKFVHGENISWAFWEVKKELKSTYTNILMNKLCMLLKVNLSLL